MVLGVVFLIETSSKQSFFIFQMYKLSLFYKGYIWKFYFNLNKPIRKIALSPDLSMLLVFTKDGEICFYDTFTGIKFIHMND